MGSFSPTTQLVLLVIRCTRIVTFGGARMQYIELNCLQQRRQIRFLSISYRRNPFTAYSICQILDFKHVITGQRISRWSSLLAQILHHCNMQSKKNLGAIDITMQRVQSSESSKSSKSLKSSERSCETLLRLFYYCIYNEQNCCIQILVAFYGSISITYVSVQMAHLFWFNAIEIPEAVPRTRRSRFSVVSRRDVRKSSQDAFCCHICSRYLAGMDGLRRRQYPATQGRILPTPQRRVSACCPVGNRVPGELSRSIECFICYN